MPYILLSKIIYKIKFYYLYFMENIDSNSREKVKYGGWGVFIVIIIVVVSLLVLLKMFMG